ncbi:MAG TPA: MBL fold metallo-hydrolase [Clostridiales bacterium]|nr:MBL fold metallo-hydrolase [Clostridiales bacterium]
MNIRFIGAVKGVTGSCHLIEFGDKRLLLDCGMFQGKDDELNYQELPFNPADIDYMVLSHSHIDHSGRIPLLVKKGFHGTIYCSRPTYDLCEIMLLDSAHIQEMETEWANRKAMRAGRPLIEPLYTQDDAKRSFKYFKPVLYEQIVNADENLTLRFNDAGHVLGSSIIEMWIKEGQDTVKIVYSGDIGMKEKPILNDPAVIESADYVIMEATYGNRLHEHIEKREKELLNIILKTVLRGGTVIIPSFAVGRTQEIIYELNKYYDSHKDLDEIQLSFLRNIPVYIDSPLAAKATEVFQRNAGVFDKEAREYLMRGDNPLIFANLHFTQNADESKQLNFSDEPKIIISSSGMCDAGRIKHHLKHNLWKKNNSIIFVGYQAEGTLGRRILDGAKKVKILGEEISVNAEVYNVEGFSGHADKNGLINWLMNFKKKPVKLFIVHGEYQAKADFAAEVEKVLGIECIIPEYDEVYEIKANNMVEEVGIEKPAADGTLAEEQFCILIRELKSLKALFEHTLKQLEDSLGSQPVSAAKCNSINNILLDLESDIVNLSMLIGK